METLVGLEYPNGRIHKTNVESDEEIRPGYEFDLHGRRWRAVKLARSGRSGLGTYAGCVLCAAVSETVIAPLA
jgi:hypothetical protein